MATPIEPRSGSGQVSINGAAAEPVQLAVEEPRDQADGDAFEPVEGLSETRDQRPLRSLAAQQLHDSSIHGNDPMTTGDGQATEEIEEDDDDDVVITLERPDAGPSQRPQARQNDHSNFPHSEHDWAPHYGNQIPANSHHQMHASVGQMGFGNAGALAAMMGMPNGMTMNDFMSMADNMGESERSERFSTVAAHS